jgi:type II secretory pathway component PulL
MATPTWNGSAVFGGPVVMTTVPNRTSLQFNAYPQLNGLEVINLGARGRVTQVFSLLSASSESNLRTAIQSLRAIQASAAVGTLVTTLGESLPYSQWIDFRPTDRVQREADGTYWLPYQALIQTLI